MLPFYRAWLSIRRLEVPTIAAVNGPAIGAGLCLALACDIRYAAAGAKLAVPFVKLGMHAGMAGTYLLPDVVGPAARARPAADRPHRRRRRGAAPGAGLAGDRPVPFPRARSWPTAEGIAATAPIASRLTKLALADGGHADFESGLQWEAMAQPLTLATEDLQEGDPGRAGEAGAAVHRPVSDPLMHGEEAPASTLPTLAFPLRTSDGVGRGPRLRANLGAADGRVNAPSPTPVDKPVDKAVDGRGSRWNTRPRKGIGLWRTRPGRARAPR